MFAGKLKTHHEIIKEEFCQHDDHRVECLGGC